MRGVPKKDDAHARHFFGDRPPNAFFIYVSVKLQKVFFRYYRFKHTFLNENITGVFP